MAEIDSDYVLVLAMWLVVMGCILAKSWSRKSPVVGLTLAYAFDFWLIHWIAAAIQLFPWHEKLNLNETVLGFKITGYAIAGLAIGSMLIAPNLYRMLLPKMPQPIQREMGSDLARHWIIVGLIITFTPAALLSRIPTLGAILSGGLALAVAGFCLLWWVNWRAGRIFKSWLVAASSSITITFDVVLRGFVASSVSACISVATFLLVRYRPRRTIVLGFVGCVLLGLSLYPNYMRMRGEIRLAVWGGQRIEQRVEVISSITQEWEWFDTRQDSHLEAIETRLNQNYLVGRAVQQIDCGNVALANGETISMAFLALIPRAVWPGKPVLSGSGDYVARFTRLEFPSGTSVGIGNVLELFINFDRFGVLVGFIVIGTAIGFVDLIAGRYLMARDWHRFALWFVSGQPLLNVGGSFFGIVAAIPAYAILCIAVNRWTGVSSSQSRIRLVQPATKLHHGLS